MEPLHVVGRRALRDEPLAAVRARKAFAGFVSGDVTDQAAARLEALAALAFESVLVVVGCQVFLQVVGELEKFATFVALEGRLRGVSEHMSDKVVFGLE